MNRPGLGGPKRNKPQRLAARAYIARRRAEGATIREIHAELAQDQTTYGPAVSLDMVKTDWQAITAEWRSRAIADVAELKGEQLASYDAVIREGWAAWHASKGEKRIETVEEDTSSSTAPPSAPGSALDQALAAAQAAWNRGRGGQDRKHVRSALRVEQRDPGAEYLRIITQALFSQARVLGLVVTKVSPTDPTGTLPLVVTLNMDAEFQRTDVAGDDAPGD